jgi:hypothetical protein
MANQGRALADRILVYLAEMQPSFGKGISFDNRDQFEAIGLRDAMDLYSVLMELTEGGLLQFQVGVVNGAQKLRQGQVSPVILTLAGWDRAEQMKRRNPDSTLAFMAMQFGDPAMDAVFAEHFRPAVAAAGLSLERVAEGAGSVDLRIGHADTRITMRHYAHLADTTLRVACEP